VEWTSFFVVFFFSFVRSLVLLSLIGSVRVWCWYQGGCWLVDWLGSLHGVCGVSFLGFRSLRFALCFFFVFFLLLMTGTL
jgi:hypothetical protein